MKSKSIFTVLCVSSSLFVNSMDQNKNPRVNANKITWSDLMQKSLGLSGNQMKLFALPMSTGCQSSAITLAVQSISSNPSILKKCNRLNRYAGSYADPITMTTSDIVKNHGSYFIADSVVDVVFDSVLSLEEWKKKLHEECLLHDNHERMLVIALGSQDPNLVEMAKANLPDFEWNHNRLVRDINNLSTVNYMNEQLKVITTACVVQAVNEGLNEKNLEELAGKVLYDCGYQFSLPVIQNACVGGNRGGKTIFGLAYPFIYSYGISAIASYLQEIKKGCGF